MFGVGGSEELVGRRDEDFFAPEVASAIRAEEAEILNSETSVRREQSIFLPSGGVRVDSIVQAPLRDEAGATIGLVRVDRDITEEKAAKHAILQSEARFRALVDGSLQSIVVYCKRHMAFANDSYCRLLGYTTIEEVIADCADRWTRQSPEIQLLLDTLCDRASHGEHLDEQHRIELNRSDNTRIWVQLQARSISWDQHPAVQFSLLDVSRIVEQADRMAELANELSASKDDLQAAHRVLDEAIGALSDGIALFDADDRAVSCNDAFSAAYGCTPAEVVGWDIEQLVDAFAEGAGIGADTPGGRRWRERCLAHHRRADGTPMEMQADGHWYVAKIHRCRSGRKVLLRSDVTHLKRAESELHRLVMIDPLTQLYNRHAFQSRGPRLIGRCHIDDEPISLLLVDIDQLETLNMSRGPAMGDQALRVLADLCREVLRPEDLLARWSGDEVTILLPSVDSTGARGIALRLQEMLAERRNNGERQESNFTISISIAVPVGIEESLDRLVTRAHQGLAPCGWELGHHHDCDGNAGAGPAADRRLELVNALILSSPISDH